MGAGQTILPPSLPAGMGHPKPLPLSPGTVLVLHRLINYEDFREGEMFALYELMRARPDLAVEILGTSTKMIITDVAMLRGHPNRCLAKRNGGLGSGVWGSPLSCRARCKGRGCLAGEAEVGKRAGGGASPRLSVPM